VVLTIVGAVVGHFLLLWAFAFVLRPWELSWQGAVVLGGAMAMSQHRHRREAAWPSGWSWRASTAAACMGVLLFQDLAVVPLLVLIPALGASGGDARRLARAGAC
jgi:CPA2 family monovalent cation:H+ antiporter-2